MSKKRTADEANNDEPTNEGSAVLQQGGNAKRAKLAPLSEITLNDLPIQFLERILAEAVATEVKGMKLAKRVWKEKVDPVISRLKNVCSRWSSILTTQAFRNEVDRILDDTAQETIRLEILHESWFNCHVHKVTAMKEEIFLLCREGTQSRIKVYDRNNLAEVKDVIELPAGKRPIYVEACNVSNCLYVSLSGADMALESPSVLRITKDDEHKFNIAPWICDGLRFPFCSISVFPNGMLAVPCGEDPNTVNIYNANGSLVWSADIHGFKCFVSKVIQKSNGNLLLASRNGDKYERVITEIGKDGKIIRQYKSSLGGNSGASIADVHGRIVICDMFRGIELLDSELNPLDFAGHRRGRNLLVFQLFYDRERNEVMGTCALANGESCLTIFRFVEE